MAHATDYIYQHFDKQLSSYICKKVNHDEICHDIMQELYLKISLQADKISKAKNAEAYITRMAGNMVADYYRRKPSFEIQDDFPGDIASSPSDLKDKSLQLADCCMLPIIQSLPSIYKEALLMLELKGISQREYAKKTGNSLPAAKSRILRARKMLKGAILQCCDYQFDKYGNIVSCCENKKYINCSN